MSQVSMTRDVTMVYEIGVVLLLGAVAVCFLMPVSSTQVWLRDLRDDRLLLLSTNPRIGPLLVPPHQRHLVSSDGEKGVTDETDT